MTGKGSRNRQFPSTISTTAFVRLYILHCLREKSYYGNELIDEIKYRMDGKWEPSPGMVYPLLRQLESDGHIVGWWDEPDKRSIRRYRITDEGLAYYDVLVVKSRPAFEESLTIVKNVFKDIYNMTF